MSRRQLFATTTLVMAVVLGLLLMHGFEALSPEPLAAHAEHDEVWLDTEQRQVAAAVGICAFVLVMIAAVGASPAAGAQNVVLRRQRGWAGATTALWKPPPSSLHELCVMRV